jgi:hypothetical protein
VEEHHGGEVGDDVREVVGRFGGEEGDDSECWKGLEGFVTFAGGVLVVSKGEGGWTYKTRSRSSFLAPTPRL